MKILAPMLLCLLTILVLAGCGTLRSANKVSVPEESASNEAVSSTSETVNKVSGITANEVNPDSDNSECTVSSVNKVSESPDNEETVTFTPVHFGEPIHLDFVDLTIDHAGPSQNMMPSNTTGNRIYMSDEAGETYFYVSGSIKNTTGDSLEISNTKIQFIFDDTYKYDGEIKARSSSGLYLSIEPLKEYECLFFKSIPDDLVNSYQTCNIRFAFNENFAPGNQTNFRSFDYRYEIVLAKQENIRH